jgi:hypothetical protein
MSAMIAYRNFSATNAALDRGQWWHAARNASLK